MRERHIDVVAFTLGEWKKLTIANELEDMKALVDCDTIQHVGPLSVFNALQSKTLSEFDFWMDDNGKLDHSEQDTITGLFIRDGNVIDVLCGGVILTHIDYEEDDCSSLEEEEQDGVLNALLPSKLLHNDVKEWAYDYMLQYSSKSWKFAEHILIITC